MASGAQAREQSRAEAAVNRAGNVHDTGGAALSSAGVKCSINMAEALAVAAALELLLSIRAMLLNVKTNVRRPDLRRGPAAVHASGPLLTPDPLAPRPAHQRNKCAHLAQRLETLEPILRRGQVRPAGRSAPELRAPCRAAQRGTDYELGPDPRALHRGEAPAAPGCAHRPGACAPPQACVPSRRPGSWGLALRHIPRALAVR